jgi:hypothetical protein
MSLARSLHVTRDPPSSRRIHIDETNKPEMYKHLGHLAGKSWSTRNKGPGVEFAPTAVHASPTLEVNLWLKNCRSAQSSSMELRREKLRSSVYVVYADWFEQGRHLLPNLIGGSHAKHMNRDMESP